MDQILRLVDGDTASEHFGGAISPLVHENHDSSMERLCTQALGQQYDGFVAHREPREGPQELSF